MTVKVISRQRGQSAEVKLDVVAVHGLDEDDVEAWTDPQTRCFWLRDLLPFDLPVRVLTFSYEANAKSLFGSGTADRILRHAQNLLEGIVGQRESDGTAERPIMFICHGVGGIIVKRALVLSSMSNFSHLHSIFTTTASIIFMGTPHLGIAKDKTPLLLRKFTSILSSSSFEKGSETLQDISEQFMPLLLDFDVYNFWETIETTSGPFRGYVVDESSAAPWPSVESSGIHATHAQMCKFPDEHSSGYKAVLAAFRRFSRKADQKITTRLTTTRLGMLRQRQTEAQEILGSNARIGFPLRQNQKKKKGYNQYFKVNMRVTDIFTGREKLARELQRKILPPDDEPETPSRQKRFVLYGLGGSGKTQFCLKFANDNKNRFWGVFWVDASRVETAENAFAEIGLMGNLAAKSEAGLSWLTRQKLPWLLVIDNADDIDFNYAKYFPPGERGHILLNSRNPECKVHATVGSKEFKELETDDAITLLLKAISPEDDINHQQQEKRGSALPVVKALGCLPLALAQAGAAIRQKFYALEEYLDIFNSYKRSIFLKGYSQDTEYKHTIYTTFEVSLDKIKNLQTKSQAAIDAVELLHVLAFFHFDEMPLSIFERAWANMHQMDNNNNTSTLLPSSFSRATLNSSGIERLFPFLSEYLPFFSSGRLPSIFKQQKWDKIRLRNAFSLLLHHSLIFQNVSDGAWSMHPMVQLWARQRLSSNAQRSWIAVTARILAASVSPTGSAAADMATGTDEMAFNRSLIPHIDSCLRADPDDFRQGFEFSGDVLSHFARFAAVYVGGGRWKNAVEIQELMVQQYKIALGQDDYVTLDAMADLAQTYWNFSQPVEALNLQKNVLSLSLQRLGPHDPRTLRAMDNLGRTFWLIGNRPEAARLGKESMEGLKNILGTDHPFTINAMHNYSRARAHLGHYQEARDLQLQALAIRSRRNGTSDSDTLETMQELGVTLLALGDINEAQRLISHVLDVRQQLLGDEHAYTLWSMNDLSKVYLAQGRFADAVEILNPTLEIATRTLGADHIGTLMTTHNLASAHARLENWKEAEALFARLIETRTRKLGAAHPDVQWAKLGLASIFQAGGGDDQLQKAEALVLSVLRLQMDTLEADSPHIRATRDRLKAIYRARGKLDDADALDGTREESDPAQ